MAAMDLSPYRRHRKGKPVIKDQMDEILESQGYYRKHVAKDKGSLFRALSDGFFGTQYFRFILSDAAKLMKSEIDEEDWFRLVSILELIPGSNMLFIILTFSGRSIRSTFQVWFGNNFLK